LTIVLVFRDKKKKKWECQEKKRRRRRRRFQSADKRKLLPNWSKNRFDIYPYNIFKMHAPTVVN
jgi:hypothetical protein